MSKVCECGVPFETHLRCVECWLLLHTDKAYCRVFNSTQLVGFTVNNIRCFGCVPGSNKNTEAEKKQKKARKPIDESLKLLRQLEREAKKERTRQRRLAGWKQRHAQNKLDPLYVEKRRARAREYVQRKNIDKKSEEISDRK